MATKSVREDVNERLELTGRHIAFVEVVGALKKIAGEHFGESRDVLADEIRRLARLFEGRRLEVEKKINVFRSRSMAAEPEPQEIEGRPAEVEVTLQEGHGGFLLVTGVGSHGTIGFSDFCASFGFEDGDRVRIAHVRRGL